MSFWQSILLIEMLVLAVLSVPVMGICAGLGWLITRKKSRRVRRIFIWGGVALPAVGVVYAIFAIVVLGLSDLVRGRDASFLDDSRIPLRDGYVWSMLRGPEIATINRYENGQVTTDGFYNVRAFQFKGDWLAGAYNSNFLMGLTGPEPMKADHWFLFNIKTKQWLKPDSEAELRDAAAAKGFSLRLQSSEDFYRSHSSTPGFDLPSLVLLVPPLLGIYWVWGKGRRLLAEPAATGS